MYSVMIVDDEKAIRENLPKAVDFETYGYQVCATAMNGEDALTKLPQYRPDVIFMDVCMPVMDGLGFLRALRQSDYKDTKVVMLSGYSDFEYAKTALRYGVKAYLTKPVDEDELYSLLEEMRAELEDGKSNRSREYLQKYNTILQALYRGSSGDRSPLRDFFVVHCIALSMTADLEDEAPYDVIKKCMESRVSGAEGGLIRSRGSIYSYLLPRQILEEYQNTASLFGRHILHLFKKNHMECVLLFDNEVLQSEESALRKELDNHLYQMATEVFFGKKDILKYEKEPNRDARFERFQGEEQFLDKLKKSILELKWDSVDSTFNTLVGEIEKCHLNVVYLQEINYRIYYLLLDLMTADNTKEPTTPILQPLEWRDTPFFITFPLWKELQFTQIKKAYSFVEQSRRMGSMGVCNDVIEFVHRHFNEPIAIKEVAEAFYMNPAYLGRIFQRATGVSLKQYVNDLRIAEAKRLLKQTNKLIYEIAEAVGFTESKYFIAKFTNETGVTPSEYRKNE